MSELLNLPLDFERLPWFRSLTPGFDPHKLTVRLLVDLAYQAKQHNRPGFIESGALGVLLREVGFQFNSETIARQRLVEVGLLREVEGGYQCDFFARFNAHLSGDHVKPAQMNAYRSAVTRQGPLVAADALSLQMVLPGELFRNPNGQNYSEAEARRGLTMIVHLDRILARRPRHSGEYGEGVIRDAVELTGKWTREQLEALYVWLLSMRHKPGVPKTAEEVIDQIDTLMRLVLGGGKP